VTGQGRRDPEDLVFGTGLRGRELAAALTHAEIKLNNAKQPKFHQRIRSCSGVVPLSPPSPPAKTISVDIFRRLLQRNVVYLG
jgi:hypothetical protein